jgi:hypothetical protein
VLAGIATAVFAQVRANELQGTKPYTPSRLEWLAVDLNASTRMDELETKGYFLKFVPLANKDTIMIYVGYMPNVDRVSMNIGIDAARKVIKINAEAKGWQDWLRVEENLIPLKQ